MLFRKKPILLLLVFALLATLLPATPASSTPGDSEPAISRFGVDATWIVEAGTKRWASEDSWSCLVDAGMESVDLPWAELDALPDGPGGAYRCEEFDASSQPEPAPAPVPAPEPGGAGDMYLIEDRPNNTYVVYENMRIWAGQCRSRLLEAGLNLTETNDWAPIGELESHPNPPNCDELVQLANQNTPTPAPAPSPEPGDAGDMYLIEDRPNNTYVVYENMRIWAGECRSRLLEAGLNLTETNSWGPIGELESHPNPPNCDELTQLASSSPTITTTEVSRSQGGILETDSVTVELKPGQIGVEESEIRVTEGSPAAPDFKIENHPRIDEAVEIKIPNLTGNVNLSFEVGDLPEGHKAGVAYFDENSQEWILQSAEYDEATGVISAEVDHLSWWNPISWCWACAIDTAWQQFGEFPLWQHRANAPSCKSERPDWVAKGSWEFDDYAYKGLAVRSCIQADGDDLLLKVVANRSYDQFVELGYEPYRTDAKKIGNQYVLQGLEEHKFWFKKPASPDGVHIQVDGGVNAVTLAMSVADEMIGHYTDQIFRSASIGDTNAGFDTKELRVHLVGTVATECRWVLDQEFSKELFWDALTCVLKAYFSTDTLYKLMLKYFDAIEDGLEDEVQKRLGKSISDGYEKLENTFENISKTSLKNGPAYLKIAELTSKIATAIADTGSGARPTSVYVSLNHDYWDSTPAAPPAPNPAPQTFGGTIEVNGSRVRSGPGTNHNHINTLNAGHAVEFECWSKGQVLFGYDTWQKLTIGGWVHDAMVDPDNVHGPVPGEPECGATPAPPAPSGPAPAAFGSNGQTFYQKNLGTPSNAPHSWNNCWVQDFNHPEYGHVIWVHSFASVGYIVRQGMLEAWLATGNGCDGRLGKPTSSEYRWQDKARQDFEGGSILWENGSAKVTDFLAGLPDGNIFDFGGGRLLGPSYVRTAPDLSSSTIAGTWPKDKQVEFRCWTRGPSVTGNTTWHLLKENVWTSDANVLTDVNGPMEGEPHCSTLGI